ncbi:autoinducer binding domain-containing protein [Iodidimonas sp. SYSU 1G8]|uniref:autoinducer binding domain-containing protein n=1 Tax=Iodidimonas sp. SYSU 1G8 TaxID=3133967 RepID=UPI0031FEDCD5
MMIVGDFFAASAQTRNREDLLTAFRGAMAHIGYETLHYFCYPSPSTRGPLADLVQFSMLPTDWIAHYDAEKYEEIDPLGDRVVHTRAPFTWAEAIASLDLSRRQKALMDDIRDAGLWDGITVPVHGPFGQVAGVALARGAAVGVTSEAVHIARVLSIQFHQAYTALEELTEAPVSALTARERDVLLRLTEGLNNAEAAARMGVTEHSVKFHVQNVCRKLNVNSRVAAVVKAIRLGLIVP